MNRYYEKLKKSDEKKAKRQQDASKKPFSILSKYNKSLNEITKEEVTKAEYKILVKYITEHLNYKLKLYPLLYDKSAKLFSTKMINLI